MNKNTTIIVALILVIAAGVGGFFGGIQYQKSQPRGTGQFAGRGFGGGAGGFGGANSNFRPVRGQILSMDSNSLTVKLSDGSTKIVVVSSTTVFVKSSSASETDLKTGDTVNAVGTQNSDGSLTASNVQINPPMMQRPAVSPTP